MSKVAPRAPPPETPYTVGYGDEVVAFFQRRRAETHASFLLPCLAPGFQVLDCGCGPGSITVGLAERVAPGTAVGIDLEPSQIVAANQHATRCGVANVRFATGTVYRLPFANASFDAVLLHGVLEHLKDPQAALAEVSRVLKPGGCVGVRGGDWGGFLLAPPEPQLVQFLGLFTRLMVEHSGDPQASRNQLGHLRGAGFARIRASASYDCWTPSPEVARETAAFLATFCRSGEFAESVSDFGWLDRGGLERIAPAFTAWGEHPAAFAAEAWGEAVAWKDG